MSGEARPVQKKAGRAAPQARSASGLIVVANVLTVDVVNLLTSMDTLSRHLQPSDLDQTLRQITEAATEVIPGADYANITIRHKDGRLETVAPTDEFLRDVDAIQFSLHEGPCYDAAVQEPYVTAPNLAADQRFPGYGPRAAAAGIHAQAGVRLFETPQGLAWGALNLYSRTVGSFSDTHVIAPLFAHQAAVALSFANEITSLEEGLRSRQQIGTAVGITMQRFGLDEQRAFGFLSRMSQDQNVKVRDLAQRLIDATNEAAT